jgi:hypothetical protein
MRTLVEPPSSLHCDHCRGELRFKELIDPGNGTRDLDEEIFICAKCGREKVFIMHHDHNMPHLRGLQTKRITFLYGKPNPVKPRGV